MIKTEKEIIAIGDIHGKYDLLVNLIENAIKFNPEKHLLIFLGDYIDRGEDSKRVVEYLIALRAKYPNSVVMLRGNHEGMAYDFLKGKAKWAMWGQNGGDACVASFGRNMASVKETLIPFIESLVLFAETESHIFVHGGIIGSASPSKYSEHELTWTRNVRMWCGEKTLVVGHTVVKDVTELPNKVFMVDTGAFHNGKLSALNIKTGEVYQSLEKKVVVLTTETTVPVKEKTKEQEYAEMFDAIELEEIEQAEAEELQAKNELDKRFSEIVKNM